jgi:hypothetical protein
MGRVDGAGVSCVVMAGLVPAIHVFGSSKEGKTWMPGTSPGMTEERKTPL